MSTGQVDALRDELTGLRTSRALPQVLEAAIGAAHGENSGLAIIHGDVDGLMRFNDHHYKAGRSGHRIGDAWLQAVARVIEAEVEAQGHAWRVGGDEFVILIPNTSAESALDLAERVRASVSRVRVEHQDCALTMTLAVALFPQHGAHAHELLKAADEALWKGKAMGRDHVYLAPAAR